MNQVKSTDRQKTSEPAIRVEKSPLAPHEVRNSLPVTHWQHSRDQQTARSDECLLQITASPSSGTFLASCTISVVQLSSLWWARSERREGEAKGLGREDLFAAGLRRGSG